MSGGGVHDLAVKHRPNQGFNEAPISARLGELDGFRTIAVVEKSVERLHLLTYLNVDNAQATSSASAPEQTTFNTSALVDNGSGTVATILAEQTRLQARYEELIITTSKARPNPLDSTLDPAAYAHIEDPSEREQLLELRQISETMKDLSKQLCRQLKENPNDQDNWKKVITERQELHTQLVGCIRELGTSAQASTNTGNHQSNVVGISALNGEAVRVRPEMCYSEFAKKVHDEHHEKIWADDIVQKEKETNMNVKTLQGDVTAERTKKEDEIEERQQRLNALKTKVRKLKQETKEAAERRKTETDAQAEARGREAMDQQRLLKEKITQLETNLTIEGEVFGLLEQHLNKKSGMVQTRTEEWADRQNYDTKDIDERIQTERKKRDDQVANLKAQEEAHLSAQEQKREREEAEKKAENDKKRREELLKSEYESATKLQAAFHGFLARKALQDGKKRKKKGGKKKKKK